MVRGWEVGGFNSEPNKKAHANAFACFAGGRQGKRFGRLVAKHSLAIDARGRMCLQFGSEYGII